MTAVSASTTHTPTSGYGFDVAIRRADDLDRLMLEDLAHLPQPALVLDLGAGAGGQSARLVRAGARVLAIDIGPYAPAFKVHQKVLRVDVTELQFLQADICQVVPTLQTHHYDSVCLQRTLHYLTYTKAKTILTDLSKITVGHLYLSVTGLDSVIGQLHPRRTLPLPERFAHLPSDAAETFAIQAPLCVYSTDELERLLTESGWQVTRIWVSAFGNIKVIANPAHIASPHD